MAQRIAITGLGVLSPIGNGHAEFWQALIAGTVGTGTISAFDTSIFDAHVGGEVRHFDPAQYFRVLNPETCPRTTQLAVAAARMAVDDADVLNASYQMERIGVCMGTTMGNVSVVEDENDRRIHDGPALDASLVSHFVETQVSGGPGIE